MTDSWFRLIVWACGWGAAAALGMGLGHALQSVDGTLGFWVGAIAVAGCVALAAALIPDAAGRGHRALVWTTAAAVAALIVFAGLLQPGAVLPRRFVIAGLALAGAIGEGGTALLSHRPIPASLFRAAVGAVAMVGSTAAVFVIGWVLVQPIYATVGSAFGQVGSIALAWGAAGIVGGAAWGLMRDVWTGLLRT